MDKYKSLKAWQRAHGLAVLTMRTTDAAYHPRARILFDQIRRAAVSVEANIVEGYALNTPGLFRRHLRIALASAAEVECLTALASELNYLSPQTAEQVTAATGHVMRLVTGLLRSLRHPS